MHSPLTRPLCGPLATALTDARVSAPAAAGTTWDGANVDPALALSAGNATATATSGADAFGVRGLPVLSTGKHVFKVIAGFGTDPSGFSIGVVPSAWDATAHVGVEAGGWAIYASGFKAHNPSNADIGLVIASGEALFVFVNFETGKIWFGNTSGPSGDPEAGTGEAYTFTANTPLYPAAVLFSDDITDTTATLTPYSSGTFAAWS